MQMFAYVSSSNICKVQYLLISHFVSLFRSHSPIFAHVSSSNICTCVILKYLYMGHISIFAHASSSNICHVSYSLICHLPTFDVVSCYDGEELSFFFSKNSFCILITSPSPIVNHFPSSLTHQAEPSGYSHCSQECCEFIYTQHCVFPNQFQHRF